MTDKVVLVKANQLMKTYPGNVQALDGVNLTIHEGEFLSIMGPSGSGKSTLLNLIGALDQPTSGEVFVAGESVAGIQDLDRFRSRTVGFVFQLHNLLPTLTARENVEIPMFERRLPLQVRRDRALQLLEEVDLAHKANHIPARLSGGERQRVAIARALANEPQLLLADEPTGNLDTVSGEELMATFRRLNHDQGMTVLVVTHDPAVARVTDRIVLLRDGRIVSDDPVMNPYWEDLREFKTSALGQSLMKGEIPPEAGDLGLEGLLSELRQVLAQL